MFNLIKNSMNIFKFNLLTMNGCSYMFNSIPKEILKLILVNLNYRELQTLAFISQDFLIMSDSDIMLGILYQKLKLCGYNPELYNFNQRKFLARMIAHNTDDFDNPKPSRLMASEMSDIYRPVQNIVSAITGLVNCNYLTGDGKLYMTGGFGNSCPDKKHNILKHIPHHLPIIQIGANSEYTTFIDINGDLFIITEYLKHFTKGKSYSKVTKIYPNIIGPSPSDDDYDKYRKRCTFGPFYLIKLSTGKQKIIQTEISSCLLVALTENNEIYVFKLKLSDEYQNYHVVYWSKITKITFNSKIPMIKQLVIILYKIRVMTFSGDIYDMKSETFEVVKIYDNMSVILPDLTGIQGGITKGRILKLYFGDKCVYSNSDIKQIISARYDDIIFITNSNELMQLKIGFITDKGLKLETAFQLKHNQIKDFNTSKNYNINKLTPVFETKSYLKAPTSTN
jgi:hypothetical protein